MSSFDTLTLILNTILQLWLLSYLWELEGCYCAIDWRRNYIMGHIIVLIVLNIVDYAMQNGLFTNLYVLVFMLFANIVYITIVITYVKYLQSCVCSMDMRRSILFIMSIVQGIILAISLLVVLWVVRQWRKIQISKQSESDRNVVTKATVEAPEYVPSRKRTNATSWFADHFPNNNNIPKIKASILVLAGSVATAIGLLFMMQFTKSFKPQKPA